jgi:hypothetical protein
LADARPEEEAENQGKHQEQEIGNRGNKIAAHFLAPD